MTPPDLQRVVVRMLYDPALVERIYGGAPVEGLDPAARAHLTRVDRRAWATDPYRRARTLQALLEEFPASAAEVGVSGLDRFFGERAFHAAIQARGSLAEAFGAWIAPMAGPVAEIERAVVAVRRAAEKPLPVLEAGTLLCAGTVVPLALPTGTCARWEGLRAALAPEPVPRLLAGFRAPARAPAAKRAPVEHLLVERGADGEGVGHGSLGLHELLVRARRPVLRRVLHREALRHGAKPAEADEILDGLVSDGLLIGG
ncbi:MAG: hypothetical protein V4850_20205 [Myxococcota bacterium]